LSWGWLFVTFEGFSASIGFDLYFYDVSLIKVYKVFLAQLFVNKHEAKSSLLIARELLYLFLYTTLAEN